MSEVDVDIEGLTRAQLKAEVRRLRDAIRGHRDQKGHDRCWLDDLELYSKISDEDAKIAFDGTLPPKAEFLAGCAQYHDKRSSGVSHEHCSLVQVQKHADDADRLLAEARSLITRLHDNVKSLREAAAKGGEPPDEHERHGQCSETTCVDAKGHACRFHVGSGAVESGINPVVAEAVNAAQRAGLTSNVANVGARLRKIVESAVARSNEDFFDLLGRVRLVLAAAPASFLTNAGVMSVLAEIERVGVVHGVKAGIGKVTAVGVLRDLNADGVDEQIVKPMKPKKRRP